MDKVVMVVDDSATIRRAVELLFRSTEYSVQAAPSAAEALSQLETVTPSIFLIEAEMNGVDGFELCKRLKERETTADTPILLMVSAENPDVAKVEAAEVDGYVLKPFGANELLDPVWMLLGESPTRDSPLTFQQQLEARKLEQQQAEQRRLEAQRAAAGILAPPRAAEPAPAPVAAAPKAGDDGLFDESAWVRGDDEDASEKRAKKLRDEKRAKELREKERAAAQKASSNARASGAAAAADLDDFVAPPQQHRGSADLPPLRPPNPSFVGPAAQPPRATPPVPPPAGARSVARSGMDEPLSFGSGSLPPVPQQAPAMSISQDEPLGDEGETVADNSGQIAQAAAAMALQRSSGDLPPPGVDDMPSLPPDESYRAPMVPADERTPPPASRSAADEEIKNYLSDRPQPSEPAEPPPPIEDTNRDTQPLPQREHAGADEIIERASGAFAANDDTDEQAPQLQAVSTMSPSYKPPPSEKKEKREQTAKPRSKNTPSPLLIVVLLVLVAAGVLFALSLTQR